MKRRENLLLSVLFFGAVWGILEATLGYALHWMPSYISGTIMFPIGVAVLMIGYKKVGSRSALFGIGVVTAAIKAINFLMPNINMFKVLNPMVAIMLETAVMAIAVPYFMKESKAKQLLAGFVTSIAWRSAFVGIVFTQFLLTGNLAKYLSTGSKIVEFIITDGLISGFMVFACIKLVTLTKVEIKYTLNPMAKSIVTAASVAIAIVLNYML